MKKINLNQLSMSWNEKQMPQKFRRYAGMLIMLLTLGVGQMWAEKGETKDTKARTIQDTTYIITPNISTQDAIYIKHEDINPTEKTWWEKYGGVIESLLAVLAGAGVSLLTTWLKDRQEEKRFEQELHNKRQISITDEGIKKEHEIYYSLLEIQNESDNEKIKAALQTFKLQLDKAKLDMTPSLYLLANDMYVYFITHADGDRDMDEEIQYLNNYYSQFTNA